MYRPREYRSEERRNKKKLKKIAWQRPAESVLFLPPTPRSELANMLKEVLQQSRWKVKVVERAGKSVKQLLTNSDPLSTSDCGRATCFVHSTGGRGDCRKHGVLYRHVCQAPECVQGGKVVGRWGESGHTGHYRGKQHLDAIKLAREKEHKADLENGMVEHYLQYHRGQELQFKMDIVQQFCRPMQRQIAEAVEIHRSKDTIIMNNKSEWHQPTTSRLVVTREVGGRRVAPD